MRRVKPVKTNVVGLPPARLLVQKPVGLTVPGIYPPIRV
jgi:hypothetical protein